MKKQSPVSQDTLRWHRLVKNRPLQTLLIFLLFLPLTIPTPCVGEAKRLFRIGTGGLTGVYYPVGKLIAKGLTEPPEGKDTLETGVQGVPGYIGVAQNSAGSIENVQMVTYGEIEAGIVQADVAAWSVRSEHAFAGDKSVRVVRAVASLYPREVSDRDTPRCQYSQCDGSSRKAYLHRRDRLRYACGHANCS